MGKNLVKVNKNDLKVDVKYNNEIERRNAQIIQLRKKHIYQCLKESANQRIKTGQRISNWIEALEKKIFDPQTIAEMDLNKAIALFKYINNINLKMLAESNRLEAVLTSYINSGAMDMVERLEANPTGTSDVEKMKTDILNKLTSILHTHNIDNAEIVEVETPDKDTLTNEEKEQLEQMDKGIGENFAELDDLDLIETPDEDEI